MRKINKQKNKDLFSGTHKYYAKYRPGIPRRVINIIIKHFKVRPSDRILDLGCGTGQVALAMEGKCREMVCLDSDPKMLEWAKKLTKKTRSKLNWINLDSKDLKKIRKNLGKFKVVTICRAFHWMNQGQVLKDLDGLIEKGGGIAIFGDASFWTGHENWQKTTKKVVQKYLGKERRAGDGRFQQPKEPWESIIARSSFKYIKTIQVSVKRNWNINSIIGWLFSSSFSRPDFFGDRIHTFKKDIEKSLLSINPKGIFQENVVFSIILASRERL